jgi:hypothetical protein
MVTADGTHAPWLRQDAVRAMVTADGTHAPWLCRDAIRAMVNGYSRWNTRTVVASRRACLAETRARPEFAVYSALNSCT